MNTDKYISGIKEKVSKKIESLRSEAHEAYRNWGDTGYRRYMTKYKRLLKEADELETFIRPELGKESLIRQKRAIMEENEALKMLLKNVQNIVEMEMRYSFPDCHETRRLEDIVYEFKSRYSNK